MTDALWRVPRFPSPYLALPWAPAEVGPSDAVVTDRGLGGPRQVPTVAGPTGARVREQCRGLAVLGPPSSAPSLQRLLSSTARSAPCRALAAAATGSLLMASRGSGEPVPQMSAQTQLWQDGNCYWGRPVVPSRHTKRGSTSGPVQRRRPRGRAHGAGTVTESRSQVW